MRESIEDRIRTGEGIDIGYWEALLVALKAYLAMANLRERHQSLIQYKIDQLRSMPRQQVDPAPKPDLYVNQ